MAGSFEKLETVLVVDDTPIVLSVVVAILKTANYNVLQVNSGHEALTVAANHRGHIDLLLSDIQVP